MDSEATVCNDPTTCDKVKEIRPWRPDELSAFRALAKWCIPNRPSLYRVFAQTTRYLAKRGIEIGYDWSKLQEFEEKLAATASTGDYVKASDDMAKFLMDRIREVAPELLNTPLVERLATDIAGCQTPRSGQE